MPVDEKPDCKVAAKLDEVHQWAHSCLHALTPDDLHRAHAIGEKILRMLDEENVPANGIKFIAVLEALFVGSDVLTRGMDEMIHPHFIN